jgi:23S rRNA (cytosine1962-C5)-methyltransferase
MATLRLKKREDKRLRAGHLWVFSNEVSTDATPLKGLDAGQAVIIESASGKFLGHAYANPHSLICARVTSRRASRPFDVDLLHGRLQRALQLREEHYNEPFYRWVFGEGDLLPGLIVDRYDDVLVVQINTAGMELYKASIVDSLSGLSSVNAIYLRNDTASRALEHLPEYREWAVGEAPRALHIRENGLHFSVPPEMGQKTGWFYDHRDSRLALRSWVKGRRVLDMYSYLGGFGLNAAAAGATEVLAIDASESAVLAANANALANALGDTFRAQVGDAVESMRALFEAGERFDVVVLDPPAFIKRRKDRDAGERHYGLNNRLAMRLLNPGGVIFSASCSQALDLPGLQQLMRQNMPGGSPGLQLLAPLQQAPDHPVNVAMPETLYLKGVIARLL